MRIRHRYTAIWIYDVKWGNPNGDPDSPTNGPRRDDLTQQIHASGSSQKRMIRDAAFMLSKNLDTGCVKDGFDLLIKSETVRQDAYKAARAKVSATDEKTKKQLGQKELCKSYWDARVFGLMANDREASCGVQRAPIHISQAVSTDPVQEVVMSITCCAAAKTVPKDAKRKKNDADGADEKDTGRMGMLTVVPYALMRSHIVVQPHVACDTGMTEEDLALFWEATRLCFSLVKSVSKGEMCTRKLVVFKHENPKGSAMDVDLHKRVKIRRVGDAAVEPRCFEDYVIEVDTENLPEGISIVNV